MWCTQWPTSAVGIGNVLRAQALVDGLPGHAAVVGAERARGGDGDEDALRIAGVEDDGVQAHAARARLPVRARTMTCAGRRVPCQFWPPSVERNKRRVFDAGIDGVGIGERRLEVPHALELPRMRRAVVPLVRAGNAVVDELVAHRLPGLAAIVGALDQLPEPSAGLRGVDAVGIGGRPLQVIHLPAGEVRAADLPLLARLPSDVQNERAFARADQNSNRTHPMLLDVNFTKRPAWR